VLLARAAYTSEEAQARAFQGLITGIGFVGAGAIVKQGAVVRGTSTAAAVWATAAVGASIAYRRIDIAITIAAATFVTLVVFRPIKRALGADGGRSPDADAAAGEGKQRGAATDGDH
jgi:putative Mg2+ transporter-C (MgtC) family protein